ASRPGRTHRCGYRFPGDRPEPVRKSRGLLKTCNLLILGSSKRSKKPKRPLYTHVITHADGRPTRSWVAISVLAMSCRTSGQQQRVSESAKRREFESWAFK